MRNESRSRKFSLTFYGPANISTNRTDSVFHQLFRLPRAPCTALRTLSDLIHGSFSAFGDFSHCSKLLEVAFILFAFSRSSIHSSDTHLLLVRLSLIEAELFRVGPRLYVARTQFSLISNIKISSSVFDSRIHLGMKVDDLAIQWTSLRISSRTKQDSFDSIGSHAPGFLDCYVLWYHILIFCNEPILYPLCIPNIPV